MAFATINADFDTMLEHYYLWNKLNKPVKTLLDGLNEAIRKENEKLPEKNAEREAKGLKALKAAPKATPCCFQVSHAMNAAGVKVPEASEQRKLFKPADGNGYYIGNVRELEQILTDRFGKTEDIKAGKNSIDKMKTIIFGRRGILAFRDDGYGYHTELWNKHVIRQNESISGNMSETGIFGQKRVLFWEVTKAPREPTMPPWLAGWWSVDDGSQYYYHFLGLDYVYWTEKKPKNKDELGRARENYGSVTMTPAGFKILWDPSGGGSTEETFTCSAGATDAKGTSNRFGTLKASKMF